MDPGDKIRLQLLSLYLHSLRVPELENLPYHTSTDSVYKFDVFAINPEWEEDIGCEGAVNRELEVRLGSRAKGPIRLTERGPGLNCVVDVLGKYLTEFPKSIILQKWVSDLMESAKTVYEEAGIPVCAVSIGHRGSQSLNDITASPAERCDGSESETDRVRVGVCYHNQSWQRCHLYCEDTKRR